MEPNIKIMMERKLVRTTLIFIKYLSSEDEVVEYAYDLDNFPFDGKDGLADAVAKFNKYINLKA